MEQLEAITNDIRETFEEVNTARDLAYQRSRQLTRVCARSIRAIHREEWDLAHELMGEARTAAEELVAGVESFPSLYHAGYTQDALKEFVEANLTYALVRDQPLPTPDELNVEDNTWLNGLAEAATELRRRILDIIRLEHAGEVEELLSKMDEIYSVLVTFDYSDSITGGLRRRTDVLRSVLERTRGDVTTSLRQAALEEALEALEQKLAA